MIHSPKEVSDDLKFKQKQSQEHYTSIINPQYKYGLGMESAHLVNTFDHPVEDFSQIEIPS